MNSYTTTQPSVDFSWKEWKNLANTKCVNKIPIAANNVNELLEEIGKNPVSDKVAFEILEICSSARFDKVEFDVIGEVWDRFLKTNVELRFPHYDIVLSYYCTNGNVIAGQRIYDDFKKNGHNFQAGLVHLFILQE